LMNLNETLCLNVHKITTIVINNECHYARCRIAECYGTKMGPIR
jgi:hypothetical protein